MTKKRKEDIRIRKREWYEKTLIFSGFALILFFLFNLSLEGIIQKIPFSEEITLALISLLVISFMAQGILRIKKGTIYEIFYTSFLLLVLVTLLIIYWISYFHNIDISIFRNLITLIMIIIFLYSLIIIKYSDRIWFIILSYAFTAIITIIIFAYIYWTISLFGLGHLQYNSCMNLDPSLKSENWFYFSSVTFYSLGYGDICPIKPLARLISQIEVSLGVIINTVLIGLIFWKINRKEVEDEFRILKK